MNTPKEFAEALKASNPDKRLGWTDKGAVGWFDGKWWPYAVATIDGKWVDVSRTGMPMVNGKPAIEQSDWNEVIA